MKYSAKDTELVEIIHSETRTIVVLVGLIAFIDPLVLRFHYALAGLPRCFESNATDIRVRGSRNIKCFCT